MEFTGSIFLNGEAELNFTNAFNLSSKWFVYYEDNAQLESFWNIGDGEQYWYRVEGICSRITCNDMGVEIESSECETDFLFLTVVSARSLKQLCQILKKPSLNPPAKIKINSVKRYTRPVLKDPNGLEDCNILVEQEICHIPECFDFCIDDDATLLFSFDTKVTRVYTPAVEIKNVNISGDFNIFRNWYEEFASPLKNLNLTSETEFLISKQNFQASGEIRLNSDSDYYSNFYIAQSDGELILFGTNSASSPNYNYQSGGVINLSLGYSRIKRDLEIVGNFNLSGKAQQVVSYNSYGILNLSGQASTLSPRYTCTPDGVVLLGLSFEVNRINYGIINVRFGFESTVSSLSVEFLESIQSSNLTINQELISPSCACTELPMFLILNHGLSNANILKEFLKRNNLSLEDNIAIRYKSKSNSWQTVRHLRGFGTDGILIEKWNIVFDLCCFQDIGDSYWKLLMSIKRLISNNEDYETKFLLDIPNDVSCVNNNLNMNIRYDSFFDEFYVNNNLLTSTLNYDEIGLFKSRFWTNNPNFVIKIGPQTTYRVDPTINLRPIFPT